MSIFQKKKTVQKPLAAPAAASQRTCRLSGASSCGRLALSSINLSAAPQCSTTPAKRRRVVDVPDASHGQGCVPVALHRPSVAMSIYYLLDNPSAFSGP